MYPFSCGFLCERDILLVRDREEDMETDSYVFFLETSTSQHHNVVLHHTHTLTNTLTLTHTHDWPTVASTGQVVPEEFFGFCNLFLTEKGRQEFFWAARGSRNIRKYFQSVANVFFCLCLFL